MTKREKLINRLIEFFVEKSNGDTNYESEKIELDNLDEACIVFTFKDTPKHIYEVEVENEHGTRYGLEELSETELTIFLYLLDPDKN